MEVDYDRAARVVTGMIRVMRELAMVEPAKSYPAAALMCARPRDVSATFASRAVRPRTTSTNPPAIASSHTVMRGHVLRHASIASPYVRGRSATQRRKSSVSVFRASDTLES